MNWVNMAKERMSLQALVLVACQYQTVRNHVTYHYNVLLV